MAIATCLMVVAMAAAQFGYLGAQELRSNLCGSFLVPRAVLAGTNSVVWISVPEPSNLTLRIANDAVLLEDKLFIQEMTPVEFQLPVEMKRETLNLQIFAECDESGSNCSLCDDFSLRVLPAVKSIEIQTERPVYRRGESVSIWTAVMDHLGNTNFDAVTDVVVRDPNNSTVKIWRNVQLSFGVGNFLLQLSRWATEGVWTVMAQSGNDQFYQQFQVGDNIGKTIVQEQVALGEAHFVEINFSSRTGLHIDENASYLGELITSTSERGILVRVELVSDDNTLLYNTTVKFLRNPSQLFVIPGLSNLPDNMTLQAVLESIEGQPVDNKFVLATRRIVVNRNSSSCRYQVFPASARYEFHEGEMLELVISSSCSFPDSKINYVVTSDSGHVTAWGQEFLAVGSGTQERFVNLTISVIDSMKPRSVISVFSDPGSRSVILKDSFEISVKPKEERNKVLIAYSNNDVANINITKFPGEMPCIVGSWDTGTNLPSPNRTTSNSVEEDRYSDATLFASVGETWMLRCLEPTESTWEEVEVILPFSTKQSGRNVRVFYIDATGKVRPSMAYSIMDRPVAAWHLEYEIPPTVRIGEELVVDILLGNIHDNCSQTQLHMALKGGALFSANGKKFLSQPACLASNSTTTYRVGVELIETGSVTFTVQVKGSKTTSCCGYANSGMVILDGKEEEVEVVTQSKTMTVLPSGFSQAKKQNFAFCLDEVEYSSNGSVNHGQVFHVSAHSRSIVFQVAAASDIRISLHREKETPESAYHFVLGGDDNSLSWISFGPNAFANILHKVPTPKLLRHDKLQTFWISWDATKLEKSHRKRRDEPPLQFPRLSLGRGANLGARTMLTIPLEGSQNLENAFSYANFSTGFGNAAYLRVWGLSSGSDEVTRMFELLPPKAATVINARAEITVTGGIAVDMESYREDSAMKTFPTLEDILENFFQNSQQNDKVTISQGSTSKLDLHFQNILKFRSPEGYFHNGDFRPNSRLTALAIQAMHVISRTLVIDLELTSGSLKWLHQVQNENGSFTSHNSDLVTETSSIITILADFQYEDLTVYQVVSSAQRFMEQELISAVDLKTSVHTASAVILSRSSIESEAVKKLDSFFDDLASSLTSEDAEGYLDAAVQALAAYCHVNKPDKYLTLSKLLINANWAALQPTERIMAQLLWAKYGKLTNEPFRNVHVGISFQSANFSDDAMDKEASAIALIPQTLEELQTIRMDSLPLTYNVPELPQTVQFSARGTGCVTLQTTTTWETAVPEAASTRDFPVDVQFKTNLNGSTAVDPPEHLELEVYFNSVDNASLPQLRIEIQLPSSYVIKDIKPLLGSDSPQAEFHDGTALLYSTEMTNSGKVSYQLTAQRHGLVRNIQPGRILLTSSFGKRTVLFALN